MAVVRMNKSDDATWNRAWVADTTAERVAFALTFSAPLGPKREDMILDNEDGELYMFTNGGSMIQITGLAALPINLNSDVTDRLPYANMVQVNGPALVGNPNPGAADANQFQPNNTGDVLQYDGTDLVFAPITDNALFYEEGTWTPEITFEVPGDLAVTYTVQGGLFTTIGNLVYVTYNMFVNTFTYTTSSGSLRLTGLPFPAKNVTGIPYVGPVLFQGITAAGYTSFVSRALATETFMDYYGCASGLGVTPMTVTNVPTGSSLLLQGSLIYLRD